MFVFILCTLSLMSTLFIGAALSLNTRFDRAIEKQLLKVVDNTTVQRDERARKIAYIM